MVFDLASLGCCTMSEEVLFFGGAGAGGTLSGTGLSGSDRDERVSNLLDTSSEAVVIK